MASGGNGWEDVCFYLCFFGGVGWLWFVWETHVFLFSNGIRFFFHGNFDAMVFFHPVN